MGRRDFSRASVGPLVSILLILGAGSAAAAPARVRVTVTRDGVAETRIVERTVSRGGEAGATSGEKVSLSGNGWRLQGVVAGSRGIDDSSSLAPRQVTISFFAKLGLAFGFINDLPTPVDVAVDVCLDPLFPGLPAVYGGSIAGSVLDGEGDGTGSVTTNSVNDPFYQLLVGTAPCDADPPGIFTGVDTLYDAPQTFTVPGVYQGSTIGEQFFGSPIPSQGGPVSAIAFAMVLRFRLTRGEFVGFTSSGVMRAEGEIESGSTLLSSGSVAPVPRVAELAPRGFPTPSPSRGPVYLLGMAVGEQTQPPQQPPAPTPTPTPATTPFNENISTGVTFPIASPSKHGGIVLGSLTDFSGATCTVRTKSGVALYRASVDGTPQFSLYGAPSSFNASGYRSGLIAPQTFGAPIPSQAGPAVATSLRLDLDFEFVNDCMATFLALYVVPVCADPSYDVDANGSVGPLTDGILILRYLFGFSGTTLTNGALGFGATRTDPAAIKAFLDCLASTMLDVDDNDAIGALTDGLLIVRHLFGFTGTTLTNGALGGGAQRTDPAALATFMNQFIP